MAEQDISGIQIEVHSKGEEDEYLLVSLTGEVNTFNGEAVLSRLKELVTTGYDHIMLDCGKLTSIDDMGDGVFICLDSLLKVEEGNLALLKIQGQPRELLEELGYLGLFSQTEDLAIKPAKPAASEFPKVFECPNCGRKVKAPAPGRYRCPKCREPIRV